MKYPAYDTRPFGSIVHQLCPAESCMPKEFTEKLRALVGGDPSYRRKALAERDEAILKKMRLREDWTSQEIQKQFGMSKCAVEKMLERNAELIEPSRKRPTEGGGTRPHKTYRVKKLR